MSNTQTYRVRSSRYRLPQGEVFQRFIPPELEAALIQGGHIETHLPETYPCETCAEEGRTKTYVTNRGLQAHISREHPDRGRGE